MNHFSFGYFLRSLIRAKNDLLIRELSQIKQVNKLEQIKKCSKSNNCLPELNRMPFLAYGNLSEKTIFWINESVRMDRFDIKKWKEYPIVFWLFKKMRNIRNGKNNAKKGEIIGEKILRGHSQTHFASSFHDDLDTIFESIQLANLRLLRRQQKNPAKLMTMFLLLSSLFSILSRNRTYSKHLGLYRQNQRLELAKKINKGELIFNDWIANFVPTNKKEIRWVKIFMVCREVGKKRGSLELDLSVSTINKHLREMPDSIKNLYDFAKFG